MTGATRRVVRDRHRDSTQWDAIVPRPDDIVIASCYKAGTTLTQQIVHLLINGTNEYDRLRNISPWVDSIDLHIGAAAVESLPSPRFLKSHLPFAALPRHPGWRYIYLVRDGRDICVSLYDHCRQLERDRPFDAAGRRVDYGAADLSTFYDQWLETGHPYWPLWDHVDSWWQARARADVLLLHFDALVFDKPTQIERIARFLGRPCTPETLALVCERSSLEHMQELERAGKLGKPEPKQDATFVNVGSNGRWRGRLSPAQIERYLDLLYTRLDPECADWIRSD